MSITLSQYQVALLAEQEMRLPEYLGSTLRGGFGHGFRRICCATSQRDCEGCLLSQQCAYALIFDPSPPPDSEALRNLEEIPRPFVIEPPPRIEPHPTTVRQSEIRIPQSTRPGPPLPPGSLLRFGLTLIGRARDFLPFRKKRKRGRCF